MKKQYNVYVIKQMVNAIACIIIELWMHLGGLLSTQEAKVASFVLSNLPRAPFNN